MYTFLLKRHTHIALTYSLLLLTNNVQAERIYKSVDADGNVTYSSRPPSEAVHIEKLSVPRNYDANQNKDAISNLEAIKKTADQFETERKQREQERKAAQKEIEAEEKSKPEIRVEKEVHYYPVYPPYYHPGKPRPPRPHPPKPMPRPTPAPVQPFPAQ